VQSEPTQTGIPEIVRSRDRIFIIYLDPDTVPVAEVVAGKPFPPDIPKRVAANRKLRQNLGGRPWRFRNGPPAAR
jgi:hypothetical protein